MSTHNRLSSNSLSSSSSSSSSSLAKRPASSGDAGKRSENLLEQSKKRPAPSKLTDQDNAARKVVRTSGTEVHQKLGMEPPKTPGDNTNKDGGVKQFRWTPAMDRCLLEILSEEAKEGKKGDKFRKSSYIRAAKCVSENFGVLCTFDNVENRLRTTKKTFNFIMTLRANSSFGWDETLKMITAQAPVYKDYIAGHPKASQYLNRKIDMYEEMAIVFGKDQVIGSIPKSPAIVNVESADPIAEYEDVMLDENIDVEETGERMPSEKQQALTPSTSSSKVRRHGKRSRSLELLSKKIDELGKQIGELVAALKNTRSLDLSHVLYAEVMKSEGFNESFLVAAFDYLNEHDIIARSFLAKNPKHRQKWLLKFHAQMVDSRGGDCI